MKESWSLEIIKKEVRIKNLPEPWIGHFLLDLSFPTKKVVGAGRLAYMGALAWKVNS